MNSLFKILLGVFFPLISFAGGSSVVGPGSPRFQFICEDAAKNIRVVVSRIWPDYDQDILSVQSSLPMNMFIEKNIRRSGGDRPGALLSLKGERFTLSILATSPQMRGGEIFVRAWLQDARSWEPNRRLELECKVMR